MPLSKTQHALSLLLRGAPQKKAAEIAGISETTLRVALARNKNKLMCPCCHQVVREGFEIDQSVLNNSSRDWRTEAQREAEE